MLLQNVPNGLLLRPRYGRRFNFSVSWTCETVLLRQTSKNTQFAYNDQILSIGGAHGASARK